MKICLSCEGISDTDLRQCGSCGTALLPIDAVHFPLRRGEEDAGNPLLGSRIDGKFRITSVLGKGGMGTVFRAVHEVSLVPVALKVLHPRYAARGPYRQGFLAEARKAGRVVHEHCARILDVGEAEDGTVYIAQELVEGETLDEWLQAEPGLAPGTAVEILVQICRALVAAHAVGLVHRDLSSRNVMVQLRGGQPFVKILDFGIAKGAPARPGHRADAGLQETASFANPAYSAPEQLAGRDVDARADLYSLGVIAYQALCRDLPVKGATGQELARATVEGRLEPLPAVQGVPLRLQRLVEQLLSRDPDRRPPSSAAVLEILERIRRPRGLLLERIAAGALIVAVSLFTVAYTAVPGEVDEVYLRLRPGQPVTLYETPNPLGAPAAPVDEVSSAQLATLVFDFSGFDPAGLRVEVTRRGELIEEHPLSPGRGPEGRSLTLRADRDADYRRLLERLAAESAAGAMPLDLSFVVERLPPLGYARVLVDDEPPELTLALAEDATRVLVAATGVTLAARDAGSIERLFLRIEAGGETVSLPVTPTRDPQDLPLGTLLARAGSRPLTRAAGLPGPVTVTLVGEDRARNRGFSAPPLRLGRVDLRAPEIHEVSAPGGGDTVTYGPGGTTLSLAVDDHEAGLRVRVWDPDGRQRLCEPIEGTGDGRLDLPLTPFRDGGDPPFRDGRYRFQLIDPAGNRSTEFTSPHLLFRSRDPQLGFAAVTGSAAFLPGLLVTDGRPVSFHLRCNDAFRLKAAAVPGSSADVGIEVAADGGYRLDLGALESGSHRLELDLLDVSQQQSQTVAVEIRALGEPVELRLPDTPGLRFLPELLDQDVFLWDGARLQQGPAWQLSPPDSRLVRGTLRFGTERPIAPRSPDEPLFGDLPLRTGRQHLDVALHDLLGRPVRVFLGGVGARSTRPEGAWRVVTLDHHRQAPTARAGVRVEHGQPATLIVDSPLEFRSDDRDEIVLELSQRRLAPLRVDPGARGGSELVFALPFEDLVAAVTGMRDLDPAAWAAGERFEVGLALSTPAGQHLLPVTLRTSRSVLTETILGELARGDLPLELRSLRLVPVLAPADPYPDPVPAALVSRSLYRTAPALEVRGVADVYLQGAELTRGQYQAAIETFLAMPAGARGDWRAVVHDRDPLGADRLRREHLLPSRLGGRRDAWRQWLRAADRPVTGLDWFQAHTVTRILGVVVTGDPDLFRLPLGLEMEMAALGPPPDRGAPRLNGLAAPRDAGAISGVAMRTAHERAARLRTDPARWPPTEAESARLGDVVVTGQGFRLVGLDFGVREWVLDLPYNTALETEEPLLREWIADHRGHVSRARDLARGLGPGAEVDSVDLRSHLAVFGVARGLALGEVDLLVDGGSGDRLTFGREPVPGRLPGVVRTLQLRRDGRDLLPGRLDPRLDLIGLRLAGGEDFVAEVRAR